MYQNLVVKEVLEIVNGSLLCGNPEEICGEFAYDTRELKQDGVYIGIKSEKSDGSIYWEKAFENGAKIVIINDIGIDKQLLKKWEDKTIIIVNDSLEALHKITVYKREKYGNNLKVIAITGSVGKTSTKDMVANVVSQKFKTLKTNGNYNNHIGLPLTLLRLKDEEVAVVEMGMNHLGEIRTLTNIAKPDLAIITNIGTSHIGNLGSRENILKAKLEILEGMDKKEIIVNNDNDLLYKWAIKNNENDIKIHRFAIETISKESKVEVWAENIELYENSSSFDCHIGDEVFNVTIPVGGVHFVYNALCAATVGNILGIDVNDIKTGIETFELTKKRMETINLKNDIVLINDAYNASLESMKASLKYLEGYKTNRKIAVFGDIFELGEFAEEMHRKVGEAVAKSKIDVLICSGENSKYIVEEARKENADSKQIYYFDDKDKIVEFLDKNSKQGDVILFKASNGMKFFDICEKFKEVIGT